MSKVLFFFISFYVSVIAQDFFKFDYCSLNCGKEEHSSCVCKRKPDHEEITFEIVNFRKSLLELHNYWRNQLAIGKDPTYDKGATNMMALSYDMELEHTARCFAVSNYQGDHDQCRKTQDKRTFGQNLVGCGLPSFKRYRSGTVDHDMDVETSKILMWWAEIKIVKDFKIADKYEKSELSIDHWTQWAWSTINRIGCARVWMKHFKIASFRYSIICHYQSKLASVKPEDASGNIIGQPIFKPGKECSECPDGNACNSKYKGLCGDIADLPKTPNISDIPLDDTPPPKSRDVKQSGSIFIIIFTTVVLQILL